MKAAIYYFFERFFNSKKVDKASLIIAILGSLYFIIPLIISLIQRAS